MITNPIIAQIRPPVLKWLFWTISIFLSILFIFAGNMAYKTPSINKNRPKAMINSFMEFYSVLGFIFPKNLKNSLSGDKINDVSPPIKAFS